MKHNLQDISRIFFIGIGGIGMSALARYFHTKGVHVSGYDKTPSSLTNRLQEEGISIHFEDSVDHLDKEADLVIYTPAIPSAHTQWNWYKTHSFFIKKRSEVLGLLSDEMFTVAVAGSHGKTTISSMIAHILEQSGIGSTSLLGGILVGYETNFLNTSSEILIVEADEFDRSFLTLSPNIAVISSIDTDHLDVYGNYSNIHKAFLDFASKILPEGLLIVHEEIKEIEADGLATWRYGNSKQADIRLLDYTIQNGKYHFDVSVLGKRFMDLRLHIGGKHNVENALAAIAVCRKLGISDESIYGGLTSFQGVSRRFEKKVENDQYIYIDDYAHHPNEIQTLLKSVRELYPGKHVCAIFQPHLYSRTKDLAQAFAHSLELADRVILLPVYPARELPIPGVSSYSIQQYIAETPSTVVEKNRLLDELFSYPVEVVVTIGAGDIDRMTSDIEKKLSVFNTNVDMQQ